MKELNVWRNIAGWTLSLFAVFGLFSSAMAKLIKAPQVIESLSKVNLDQYIIGIGILEISCIVLFLIPKTSRIGFYLLMSYIGGIIAIELSAGNAISLGVIIGFCIFFGTYLRKPEMFNKLV